MLLLSLRVARAGTDCRPRQSEFLVTTPPSEDIADGFPLGRFLSALPMIT